MIVVLGSRFNKTARHAVRQLGLRNATLLSCEDMSRSGWRDYSNKKNNYFIASGKHIGKITGVLTLRPAVFKEELFYIQKRDRAYVAAEMTAFLTYWLHSLDCPILNPPSASCLSGPGWRPVQWLNAAAKSGFKVEPASYKLHYRSTKPSKTKSPIPRTGKVFTLAVMENYWIGDKNKKLARLVSKLARIADVRFLEVTAYKVGNKFLFVSATQWPDCSRKEIMVAATEYLGGKKPKKRAT